MITSILAPIFVLGLLIFVHELGHFLAAKRMGIKVERFSLGFPPKMYGKKFGETEYCISWVPLGGYVKMAGEYSDAEEVKGEPWEFQSKSIGAQAFVIAAGPAMNVLLSLIVLWGLFFFIGEETIDTTIIGSVEQDSPYAEVGLAVGDRITAVNNTPVDSWNNLGQQLLVENTTQFRIQYDRTGIQHSVIVDFRNLESPQERLVGIGPFLDSSISTVVPSSPAARAGLQPGDVITEIAGQPVIQWTEMVELIRAKPGIEITVAWTRNGQPHQALMIPDTYSEVNATTGAKEDIGRIGVTKEYYRSHPFGFLESFQRAGAGVVYGSGQLIGFIKGLIMGEVSAKMVGGPIFIVQLAGETARRGAKYLFELIAFLSLNLAVLNLLPIPALDGGQLLVLGVEGVIRRPLSVRQRLVWQQVGMAILAFIMVFVIVNDISRNLQ